MSFFNFIFVQIAKCICPTLIVSDEEESWSEEELKRSMCLYFHRKHSCWIRCMDSDREIERCSILLSSWETEGFRKQSYPRPPTITGLTPPDPHITAPSPIYTYSVHHQTNIQEESMAQGDPAWCRGWGININTARSRAFLLPPQTSETQRSGGLPEQCPTASPDFFRVAQILR